MSEDAVPPIASLHTPKELLEIAQELLSSENPKYYRGAVLEALAALETFVHETVFSAIRSRFSNDFSKWLEDKTKMNFDDRISILVPFATGMTVDKNSRLWNAFKKTRELRKGVVHGRRKVSKSEAETVINNTAEWMAYLGSTLEFEASLLELKRWVEAQPAGFIASGEHAERIVEQFFMRSRVASVESERWFVVDGRRYHVDVILEFGGGKLVVEVKFLRGERANTFVLSNAIAQVERICRVTGIGQACVIIFTNNPDVKGTQAITQHADSKILSIAIYAAD